ncbi:hypothetical protein [Chamaesiphon sp. OTE_8_metabat_110]|uniref:hypothetical protein n=1 Tax=Chamaesiphon sp. OTE_8_metabat_110 TaxID=2964696 RepID=UPI00286BA05A|nr:hypothetical protein [Chamaesiphon sp. OTE_8_metabat_110]
MTNSAHNLDRTTPQDGSHPSSDSIELTLNPADDRLQSPDLMSEYDEATQQQLGFDVVGDDRSLSAIEITNISDRDRNLQILNDNGDRNDLKKIDSKHQSDSIEIDSSLDVRTELDLLLTALEQSTPHPPTPSLETDDSSISSILTQIATVEPVTHVQESIQALNASREQLTLAQSQLQILAQRNQTQIDRVDANVLEVKQIKFRIQQLAQHSKSQIEHVERILNSLSKIHTEIVTNLAKFGGYDEIRVMLSQLEAARYALVIAHDRVNTGQENFYDSLKLIQAQVAARSDESEAKLDRYQQSIQSLSQAISTDRLRIAGMSVEMSTKTNELHSLSTEITTIHDRIVEKSQTLQAKITRIDRSFSELSQSMQQEKEQFYELTAESIEKADLVRSQLDEIIKQISDDRAIFTTFTAEIEALRSEAKAEAERQFERIELRDFELSTLANNFKIDRKQQLITTTKLTNWLWILSGGVGIILVLLIRLSIAIK